MTELSELGAGAQGRVVLGRRPDGTRVAVKYLNPGAAGRAEFRREAEILAHVANPHVARLLEYVEDEDGSAIVMEAVEGVALRRLLTERDEPLPPEAALTILKGSLLGLAAAHDLKIVHRDFKPANIIVQPDGESRLIDFGIALLAGEGDRSGTPAYMAPEQWAGDAASPATDVYSATCVFFECVTGRVPFKSDTVVQLRAAHLASPPPVDLVPEPLRPLVEAGLAKAPESRPPGAAEFADELELLARETYGEDWQSRGTELLAASAATLSVAFPAAALAAKGVLAKLAAGKFALGAAAVATTAVIITSLLTWPEKKQIRPAWRLSGIVPTSDLVAIGDVFAFYGAREGGAFELITVDARSGKIRWRAPVNASYTRDASGFAPLYNFKDADNDDTIVFQRRLPGPANRLVEIVSVDARTGKEQWVYGKGGIRIITEPFWCAKEKICLTRRDLESGVENSRALDPRTGKEVAVSQAVDGHALGMGLFASPALDSIMRIDTDGTLYWKRPTKELIGRTLSIDAGWSVGSYDGESFYLRIGGPDMYLKDGSYDYAKGFTLSIDHKTGKLLWRDKGSRHCGTLGGDVTHPVRCRVVGRKFYGANERMEIKSVVVEGFDHRTGKTTWTWNPGPVTGLVESDATVLAVDENIYLVRTSQGVFRFDATKAGAAPATGAQIGWCWTQGRLHTAQGSPTGDFGYTYSHNHPCNTAGLRLDVPVTTPSFAGEQIGDIFAWADLDGIHAVHAPPAKPVPTLTPSGTPTASATLTPGS
ncbi:hypothetical protein GCM10027589_20220 [Actinocorallia lasiicapitis]